MNKWRAIKWRIRDKLKIGRLGLRLTLSFAILVLLTFLGSAIGLWQFIQVRQQAQRLSHVDAVAITMLQVNNQVLKLQSELRQLAETRDAAQFTDGAIRLRDELATVIRRATDLLSSSTPIDQAYGYTNQFQQLSNVSALSSQIDSMISLAQAGDWPAIQLRLEDEIEPVSQITQEMVNGIDAIVMAERQAALATMARTERQALTIISAIGALTLTIAIMLSVLVTRSIAHPLARLNIAARALARREFNHRLEVVGHGELAVLTGAFIDASSQLEKLYSHLEALVEERTDELQRRVLQLETSLAVGHRITSFLDLDTLLTQVVELIKERYRYYFVGVFLLDERKEYIVARAGTGEAGLLLRQQRFRLKVGEEGIVGWVAAHRRPLRVDDVSEDDFYQSVDIIPNTRSELALPLTMGRRLLGVLDIQSDQTGAFRLDDVPVLQSLADQVAIAIQNASLYQGEKSRRQLTEALYEAGRAISGTLEVPEVLDLILKYLAEIVPYDRAAVMLQDRDELQIVAANGFPDELSITQRRIPVKEHDVFQEISQSQQPLAIPDVQERPDWQQVTGLPPARAWLGVPLIRFEWVIGMLSLARETPEPYGDDEIALASTFAGQAAIALENARLYEKIIRFTQELEDMVRERTEAVQEAYFQLEQLDQAKSDFINVAAHELRTPLTLLKGYSQMLLKDSVIQETPFHYELISGIHSGSGRLHEVVNSMLDIAKIDSRALELYPEPVLIPSLIELVCQGFAEAIAERNLSLVIEDMTTLPAIEADPEALNKVFYHLIMNAIKYTPDRGTVTVSGYSKAERESALAQASLEIVVHDAGIGIDPEFHELIFKKFYQTGELALHSSGKTKFKGAGPGLGLAIVQGIVEAHRGKVWVESSGYDEATCPGSEFHVLLPMRQNKPTDHPDPNLTRSTKRPQILLKPGPYKF